MDSLKAHLVNIILLVSWMLTDNKIQQVVQYMTFLLLTYCMSRFFVFVIAKSKRNFQIPKVFIGSAPAINPHRSILLLLWKT